jgi:hypothetical protein
MVTPDPQLFQTSSRGWNQSYNVLQNAPSADSGRHMAPKFGDRVAGSGRRWRRLFPDASRILYEGSKEGDVKILNPYDLS